MNVTCPECRSVFRVDPAKLPASERSRAVLGLRRSDHDRAARRRRARRSSRPARRRRPAMARSGDADAGAAAAPARQLRGPSAGRSAAAGFCAGGRHCADRCAACAVAPPARPQRRRQRRRRRASRAGRASAPATPPASRRRLRQQSGTSASRRGAGSRASSPAPTALRSRRQRRRRTSAPRRQRCRRGRARRSLHRSAPAAPPVGPACRSFVRRSPARGAAPPAGPPHAAGPPFDAAGRAVHRRTRRRRRQRRRRRAERAPMRLLRSARTVAAPAPQPRLRHQLRPRLPLRASPHRRWPRRCTGTRRPRRLRRRAPTVVHHLRVRRSIRFSRTIPTRRRSGSRARWCRDIVAYFPQKREEGLRDGTLKQLFREEIKKSYEEYVEQIGREFADSHDAFPGRAERRARRGQEALLVVGAVRLSFAGR